jgi:hypothetical protein
MGIVYKVRDLETQDIIALKILKAGSPPTRPCRKA